MRSNTPAEDFSTDFHIHDIFAPVGGKSRFIVGELIVDKQFGGKKSHKSIITYLLLLCNIKLLFGQYCC